MLGERRTPSRAARLAGRDARGGSPDASGPDKYRLAKDSGVPLKRIRDIVAGERGITADTDLRLCRCFGLSDGWWLRGLASSNAAYREAQFEPALALMRPRLSASRCHRRSRCRRALERAGTYRRNTCPRKSRCSTRRKAVQSLAGRLLCVAQPDPAAFICT